MASSYLAFSFLVCLNMPTQYSVGSMGLTRKHVKLCPDFVCPSHVYSVVSVVSNLQSVIEYRFGTDVTESLLGLKFLG